jgi:hypothetical protein
MRRCEIIYFKDVMGWKWRTLGDGTGAKPETSDESFPLFYECVLAARAKGLRPELQRRSMHPRKPDFGSSG